MLKIVYPFGRMSDADLDVAGDAIITAGTGNPNMPVVPPQFTALVAAQDEYSTALGKAASGDKTDIEVKNQKKLALVLALVAMGKYALSIANEDPAVVISLGFEVASDPSPLPPLVKPELKTLKDGPNAGELEARSRGTRGGRVNVFQYTQDPITAASVWISQSSTTSKAVLKGLESGKKYWVRVLVYGTGDQAVYSDPVCRIVQ